MKLLIGRLQVRTKVPKRLRARAPDAVRLARDVLPRTMATHLDRLPSRPAVCRIRRLKVRVQLVARELDEAHVANACAEAFFRALLSEINQPPGNGNSVVAVSTEEWLADVIVAILDGRFSAWTFEEFATYDGQPAPAIVASLARDRDADWPAVLAILAARGQLDRLIQTLSAAGCRELARNITTRGSWSSLASVDDLAAVGRLFVQARAARALRRLDPFDIEVIRCIAACASPGADARRFAPETLRSAFVALAWLAQQQVEPMSFGTASRHLPLDQLAAAPALINIVQTVVEQWQRPLQSRSSSTSDALSDLLPSFRTSEQRLSPAANVRESAVAGLFLLVSVIEQLQWPERIRHSAPGAAYGTRALTYVLTGTALEILGKTATEVVRLDPGVEIFAGWLDRQDPSAVARMCATLAPPAHLDCVRTLIGGSPSVEDITDWNSAFARLGSELVRRFGARLRGFSRSSEQFIVDRMLAVPGTIAVDDRHVSVRLQANAFWPVVRLSGADETVEAVSWLGRRRVTFELEGV